MKQADPAHVTAAERMADAAGAILRGYFRSGLPAALKGDASPVTEADRRAETAMRAVVEAEFAGHAMLGEEAGRGGAEGARFCWTLDPIDGTRAFITGRATFATLIALLDEGEPVLGVIDQPITGERWVGCAGATTRFSGGAGRVGTRRGLELEACELSCTSPLMFDAGQASRFEGLRGAVARTSYGGDGYAYGLLALGQIDIVAEPGLKLWDWAALVPVLDGAGGCVTDWDGAALRAADATPAGGMVLALGDPGLLGPAVRALRGATGNGRSD